MRSSKAGQAHLKNFGHAGGRLHTGKQFINTSEKVCMKFLNSVSVLLQVEHMKKSLGQSTLPISLTNLALVTKFYKRAIGLPGLLMHSVVLTKLFCNNIGK